MVQFEYYNTPDSSTAPSSETMQGIAKIVRRADCERELDVVKNIIGQCLACGETAHSYVKKFLFGKATWP